MKTKIRTISLMTLGVFILSFFVINTIIKEMTEEAKNPYKVYQGSVAPSYNSNAFVMKVSAHKTRSATATRHRSANRSVNRQNAESVYVPIKSVDKALSSGFSTPGSDNSIYSRRSKKSVDENSMNYRPMAVIPSWSAKPSGTMNLVTSGKDVQSELVASNMSAPFSDGNNSGPMRMEGEGDNPPPEGMPVGNGVWAMLFLSAGYILYRRKFAAH